MEKEKGIVGAPYDDVFRTLVNDCVKLLLPMINEVFHEQYIGNEEIYLYPNEHFLNQQDGDEQKRITDTCFGIQGEELKLYHWECQSSPDNSMLVRMFEYDSQIALDRGKIYDNILTVNFPYSAVLFLRSTVSVPDRMKTKIVVSGRVIQYDILVMKSQTYTIKEIFEKKLLLLIPFHIFSYEGQFQEYNEDDTQVNNLMEDYRAIREQLEELCRTGEIDEYTKCTIVDMSNKVLEHIARNYSRIREGVKSVMGGKVLEYEAKTILNKGISQGRIETYRELIHDGFITFAEAARRLHMEESELMDYVGKEN
ncbi:MAG: hypothetical protein Q4D94_01430 [Bacillota bacterium]|nr:hypothetical protein [Bacillota bacterium]